MKSPIEYLQPNPAESKPAFKKRLGKCYFLSAKYVIDHPGMVLVHGTIQGFGQPANPHAWVELPDGSVYDPVADGTFPKSVHQQLFHPVELARYSREQVLVQMLRNKHWGPWDEASFCVRPGRK